MGIRLGRESCSKLAGLGEMDPVYQRGNIQEESMYYEYEKYPGSLPLIVVNTFLPKDQSEEIAAEIELIRSTEEEKGQQLANVRRYGGAMRWLLTASGCYKRRRAIGVMCSSQLIEVVKYNSLGQISHALYELEEYRRNMQFQTRSFLSLTKMDL